jgi:hypothetical protein
MNLDLAVDKSLFELVTPNPGSFFFVTKSVTAASKQSLRSDEVSLLGRGGAFAEYHGASGRVADVDEKVVSQLTLDQRQGSKRRA